MTLFAASALETLQTLPAETWAKIGIAVGALIITVIVLRKLANTNKVIMGVVVFVVCTVVFFSWIYNRNEPKFMTPVIEKLAPFFPSAGAFKNKQQNEPRP